MIQGEEVILKISTQRFSYVKRAIIFTRRGAVLRLIFNKWLFSWLISRLHHLGWCLYLLKVLFATNCKGLTLFQGLSLQICPDMAVFHPRSVKLSACIFKHLRGFIGDLYLQFWPLPFPVMQEDSWPHSQNPQSKSRFECHYCPSVFYIRKVIPKQCLKTPGWSVKLIFTMLINLVSLDQFPYQTTSPKSFLLMWSVRESLVVF